MADLHVTIQSVSGRSNTGGSVIVGDSRADDGSVFMSETLSGSATTDMVVPVPNRASGDLFWLVQAINGPKWVAFGPNPNASQNPRRRVYENSELAVRAHPGDKCATVDA